MGPILILVAALLAVYIYITKFKNPKEDGALRAEETQIDSSLTNTAKGQSKLTPAMEETISTAREASTISVEASARDKIAPMDTSMNGRATDIQMGFVASTAKQDSNRTAQQPDNTWLAKNTDKMAWNAATAQQDTNRTAQNPTDKWLAHAQGNSALATAKELTNPKESVVKELDHNVNKSHELDVSVEGHNDAAIPDETKIKQENERLMRSAIKDGAGVVNPDLATATALYHVKRSKRKRRKSSRKHKTPSAPAEQTP